MNNLNETPQVPEVFNTSLFEELIGTRREETKVSSYFTAQAIDNALSQIHADTDTQ